MLEITEVLDVGNDVLLVRATDEAGRIVEATGHVSATTNHFDASAYAKDGHRKERAKPRAMTPVEVGEYARRLLDEQNQTTTPIAFEAVSG